MLFYLTSSKNKKFWHFTQIVAKPVLLNMFFFSHMEVNGVN